jgi:hypothetical protein
VLYNHEAFIRNIEQFVAAEGVDLVTFEKGERKDDVTQKYLREFKKSEGVLYVGKAQEKARVMRTERWRCSRTGATPVDRSIDGHGQPLLFLLRRRGLWAVLPQDLLLLSPQRQALHQWP